MKRIFTVFTALSYIIVGSAQNYPFMDQSLSVDERMDDLIARMTLEEKIDILTGYNDFYIHPCERLGIPAFKMADGPLGLSSWGLWGKATAFPSALSLASSWNRDLARELGDMYGQEWRARGIHFLLAPGVNNYRASKGARNFEYFGEDPYLASEMVVPFIEGVQNRGVIATVKHFAANDQEYDRYNVSSEISERVLREITLPPFHAAVQRAGVKAVMTGYNPVNGVYCTENEHLIGILKDEWDFKGMLMSDWACTYSADKAANAGLDMEMGSADWFIAEKLIPLIEQGIVSEETINDKVRRIYGTCMEMGFFDRDQQDVNIPVFNPAANRMAYEAAKEGIILLKNEILPLNNVKKIAVIGPNANPSLVTDRVYDVDGITYGGGGSSKVHPWYVVSNLQGIMNEFPDAEVLYSEGISNAYKPRLFRKSAFVTAEGDRGLKATFKNTEGIVSERVDRRVDNMWYSNPFDNLGNDWSVEWDGYIEVSKDDRMNFFVDAQGGYRLWLDGNLAIDASSSESFHFGEYSLDVRKGNKIHVKLEYLNQRSYPAEIRMGYDYQSNVDFSEAIRIASGADVVVFCGGVDGRIEKEGRDRPFELPYGQNELIKAIAEVNPNIVLSLNGGGAMGIAGIEKDVKAIVHLLYPGQEGGHAFAEVLSGKVNPSAKLPFTMERAWEDSPAYGNYDETRKDKKVYYNEGIFVGYRGYDKKGVAPLYPFGYGLSYTTFSYSNLEVKNLDKKKHTVTLTFDITNTGARAGAEVVQIYVSDLESKEPRPEKELKAFEKVWLEPGETESVSATLGEDAFRYFSEKSGSWTIERGDFEIRVGASSKDIRLKTTVKF